MCGIVGFIAGTAVYDKNRPDFLEQALYADALRGRHSTGVFTIEGNGKAFYSKDIVDAQRYLDSKGSYSYVRSTGSGCRAAVGHNRYATQGGRGIESAHPFVTPHVTLVHNGTLRDYGHLPKHAKADVDSARLAQALSNGRSGGKAVLEELKGAYAIVWHDNRTHSIYLARNDERPLWFVTTKNNVWFASEGRMLEWILIRNGIMDNPVAKLLPTHAIHKWAVTGNKQKLNKPRVVTYTPPKPPVVTEYGRGSKWWEALDKGGKQGTELALVDRKGATSHAAVPSAPNAGKINAALKKLGLNIKHGDILEVQAGEVKAYKKNDPKGMTLGWFGLDDEAALSTDKFKGQLWADVHHIPILGDDLVDKGHWHDSYYARVVGIGNDANDWMSAGDSLLICTFEAIAARQQPFLGWHPKKLQQFFKTGRYMYNSKDVAKWDLPLTKARATNRELDMLVEGQNCDVCASPATLLKREELCLHDDYTNFTCLACATQPKKKG